MAGRLERSYLQEERIKLWEKEQRLLDVKEKKRKCLVNLEARNKVEKKESREVGDEQKSDKIYQMEGNDKEAGKWQGDDKKMCDVWKFWRQRSPMVPETPLTTTGNSNYRDASTPPARER